ncbi:MAG: dihydroorotate dehydrogenase-like protein [Planctomycetes bacterium]|nr:dihydroorotate dehydrogenase-like protein [Planctomycetota bacterium]
MNVDLSTKYVGLELKNPLVVASCPLAGKLDSLQRFEEAGAAAVILPSLFEEQIVHDEREVDEFYQFQTESYAESLSLFPELETYNVGAKEYLDLLEAAKGKLGIPVFGSLNGISGSGWRSYAKSMESAGADAIELVIFLVPTAKDMSAANVEEHYAELVSVVRDTVRIPVAVKLGPFFTALPSLVQRVAAAGADALVLFNRFLEPDFDLDAMEINPSLVLSNRYELRLALRWIAIIRDQTTVSLAATGGAQECDDVVKALMAGADIVQMAGVLMRKGPSHFTTLLRDLENWLSAHEYASVEQLKGSMSRNNCPNPSALERAGYMKALTTFTTRPPA